MRGDPLAVRQQFGRNLLEARGWEGLTQEQLAEQAQVSRKDIFRLEYGLDSPRLDIAVRLADALGVQVRDLLYGIE